MMNLPPKKSTVGQTVEDAQERTLFVGNLPYKMSYKHVKDVFKQFGCVTFVKMIMDHKTGQSKGFCFVEFEKSFEADRALQAPKEQMMFFGRVLDIKRSRQKNERSRNGTSVDNEKKEQKVDVSQVEINANHPRNRDQEDTPINKLSDDELIAIMSYLTPTQKIQIERVCRRWRLCSLAAAKTVKHVKVCKEFKSFGMFTETHLTHMLSRCGGGLRGLDISSVCSKFDNKALAIIAKHCKNLEVLDMPGISADNRGMEELSKSCLRLKALNVKSCHDLSEKALGTLLTNCTKLESLNCSESNYTTGKFLRHAGSHMKSLCLGQCPKLTTEGLLNIASRCPKLKTLELNRCDHQTLHKVLEVQTCLEKLNLGNNPPDPPRVPVLPHFISCVKTPELLTQLEVCNSGLYDSSLSYICQRCVNLTHLDVSCNKLTDISVSQISHLKYLQFLHVCHLRHITDSCLNETVKRGNLKRLRIQGCKKLSDKTIETLTKHCFHLEEIDIAGIPFMTWRSVEFLSLAAARSPSCRISFYTAQNAFSGILDDKFPLPKNLSRIDNYRPLYAFRIVWHVENDVEINDLSEHNIELDEAKKYNTAPRIPRAFLGGHMFVDAEADEFGASSEDDFLSEDEFLINDDPLEEERFDLS